MQWLCLWFVSVFPLGTTHLIQTLKCANKNKRIVGCCSSHDPLLLYSVRMKKWKLMWLKSKGWNILFILASLQTDQSFLNEIWLQLEPCSRNEWSQLAGLGRACRIKVWNTGNLQVLFRSCGWLLTASNKKYHPTNHRKPLNLMRLQA